MEYNVGDIVKTKKPNPCVNEIWKILGIGLKFRIKCTKCGYVIVLDRTKALKKISKKIQ